MMYSLLARCFFRFYGPRAARGLLFALLLTGLPAVHAQKSGCCQIDPATADEAFLAVRDAARRADLTAMAAYGNRLWALDASYPLAAYVDYWPLSQRLKSLTDPIGDEVVRAFLAANEGTIVGDLARRDWLLALGKRRDFKTFDAEYPRFILKDDAQVECFAVLSRHLKGENVADAARAVLGEPRNYQDGCAALAVDLAAEGKLRTDEIWMWMRLASDINQATTMKRYGALLPAEQAPAPKTLDAVYDRPASWLARFSGRLTETNRELVVLALSRMARSDPESTATLFEREWSARLPEAERAYIWAQLAAAAARKLLPVAPQWVRHATGAPHLSDDLRAWHARAALRAQDWPLLRSQIEAMPEALRNEATWIYWHGRALQAEGRSEEAGRQFARIAGDFSFYGQLAQEELGRPIVVPPPAAPVTEQELAMVAALPGFARALKFYQLDLRAQGNLEWNFTLRGMNDRQLLAASEWARRNAILDRSVNTADRTRDEHEFGLRFPMPFRDRMQPRVEATQLDINWVYGLIRQESRFIMNARSSAGASGLMQLMPATARWVARKIGLHDYHHGRVTDMDVNLTLGTSYLRMVLDDLDNLPVLATAAYNAGPGRPRAWRSTLNGPVEGAIFAETIPFNETRDYVKKVMSNATYYAALFDGSAQSLKTRMGFVAPKGYTATTLP